ncbi:MFS transporter [Sphingomonas sp. TX0543]|uniref:MFS transporter n=1 Tax=Sphingomonas sp. TX0543 TaxID=3399682 RepID=UPI003AFABFEB
MLGCTIGLGMGASILLYINGVFVTAFKTEFGWTRSQLAMINVITVLTVIPLAPLAGIIVDRWGPRRPAVISMALIAVGFTATGCMSGNFLEYLALYLATSVTGLLSSPISYTRAINENFVAARGLALGLSLTGLGITGVIAPPAMAAIMAAYGWRMAYFALAGAICLAILPVYLLLKPSVDQPSSNHTTSVVDTDAARIARIPFRHLIGDKRLLRLMALFFFMAIGVTGFTLHLIPMLTDGGMAPIKAAAIQSILGIAIICGRLVTGAAADHFFAPRVAAISMSITVCGMIAMATGGMAFAPLFVLGIGLALGAESDLIGYLTARYFGINGYGQRYGVLYSSYLLANGFSPLLIALVSEHFGSYQPALLMCAAFASMATILLLTAPRFPPQSV